MKTEAKIIEKLNEIHMELEEIRKQSTISELLKDMHDVQNPLGRIAINDRRMWRLSHEKKILEWVLGIK